MYVWSLLPEKGAAYWTNSRMIQAEAGFRPWKPLTLKSVLYVDDAFHPYAKRSPAKFSSGTHRGEIPELLAFYKFSDRVAGEFRYEVLAPGDFYTGKENDQFFRFEVNYSWKHSVEQ